MRRFRILALLFSCLPALCAADLTELVPESTIALLAEETSGISAKRNLDTITLFHRTRASSQYRRAAEHILGKLKEYGLQDAQILEYPADGETMFGTQKSRPAWDVEFAELWELDAEGNRSRRHASWEALPLSVAQDSVSGQASGALLVDIGAGTSDADFEGKNLEGRLVLTGSQPETVAGRAVGELGAAGIISYAPNQKSAWWKEDDRLVRWGHLDTFSPVKTFAFMVSLGVARQLKARLAAGEDIRFDAEIRAQQQTGLYTLVSATIPGTDRAVSSEEIAYSCHLDHPRPGANDNASGCVAILEAARALQRLIDTGALPAPRRTLRFTWPAEIEGTLIYLSSLPGTSHIKANIHLDMVGGNSRTKSIFRISGGPMSLPSFIADIGHEIGHFVNDQTEAYASGSAVPYPLVSKEGSKNPQLAIMEGISLGSDHQVFNEGSWRIPGIYLHDWPDRYIHTNFDTAAMIDPTKLKRAAFIAALQGWHLSNFDESNIQSALDLLRANSLSRARERMLTLKDLAPNDRAAVVNVHLDVERQKVASIGEFAAITPRQSAEFETYIERLAGLFEVKSSAEEQGDDRVYRRNPDIKGPMNAFGYSYLQDHLPESEYAALKLNGAMAYEALNLVDGNRTVSEIRRWLLAEFGKSEMQHLGAYLEALEEIGVVRLD
jgi:hypothetical protein